MKSSSYWAAILKGESLKWLVQFHLPPLRYIFKFRRSFKTVFELRFDPADSHSPVVKKFLYASSVLPRSMHQEMIDSEFLNNRSEAGGVVRVGMAENRDIYLVSSKVTNDVLDKGIPSRTVPAIDHNDCLLLPRSKEISVADGDRVTALLSIANGQKINFVSHRGYSSIVCS